MNHPFAIEARPGISVVACCMDRNEFLSAALRNWLTSERIDEIVIVDWSSETPVEATLSDIDDPRIRLARVEGEPAWILSCAYNLAARLASRDRLLKLDADVTLSPDFFATNPLRDGMFYRGNAKQDGGLTGMAYLRREDFIAINGYSEYLRTYGWDDVDFFLRLQLKRGLAARTVKEGTSSHRPHGDPKRLARHPRLIGFAGAPAREVLDRAIEWIGGSAISAVGRSESERRGTLLSLALADGADAEQLLEQATRLPLFHIMRNRYICEVMEWSSDCSMAQYRQLSRSSRSMRLARDKSGERAVPQDAMQAAELYALATLFYTRYPEIRSAAREIRSPPASLPA